MPVTIIDIALARGAKADFDGMVDAHQFNKVGLPMMGGCVCCGATIAAYNSSPTITGHLMCTKGCADDHGFDTVANFETWVKEN